MVDRTENDTKCVTKGLMATTFSANYLLVLFLRKKLSLPYGDLAFFVKGVGTLVVVTILTVIMIQFLSRKTLILLIPIIIVLALVAAVT